MRTPGTPASASSAATPRGMLASSRGWITVVAAGLSLSGMLWREASTSTVNGLVTIGVSAGAVASRRPDAAGVAWVTSAWGAALGGAAACESCAGSAAASTTSDAANRRPKGIGKA